jgi:hypothetical protein
LPSATGSHGHKTLGEHAKAGDHANHEPQTERLLGLGLLLAAGGTPSPVGHVERSLPHTAPRSIVRLATHRFWSWSLAPPAIRVAMRLRSSSGRDRQPAPDCQLHPPGSRLAATTTADAPGSPSARTMRCGCASGRRARLIRSCSSTWSSTPPAPPGGWLGPWVSVTGAGRRSERDRLTPRPLPPGRSQERAARTLSPTRCSCSA